MAIRKNTKLTNIIIIDIQNYNLKYMGFIVVALNPSIIMDITSNHKQADIMDVNQIFKELALLVHQQNDVVG